MDVQEAFKILSLPINASGKEIENQFKELAKINHPDRGGIDKEMRNISRARDVAIAYSNKNQLVLIEETKDLITNGLIQFQNSHIEMENTQNQINRKYVSRYKNHKRKVTISAAFTGFFAFFDKIILDFLYPVSDPVLYIPFSIISTMKPLLIFITLIMGFFYWYYSTMAENIKSHIDNAVEELDQKEIYFYTLNEIIQSSHIEGFTQKQLIDLVNSWLGLDKKLNFLERFFQPYNLIFSAFNSIFVLNLWSLKELAKEIGPKDFTRILIKKGLEKGVLEEKEIIDDQKKFSVIYISKYINN